jgi:hypothetical protein
MLTDLASVWILRMPSASPATTGGSGKNSAPLHCYDRNSRFRQRCTNTNTRGRHGYNVIKRQKHFSATC